MALSSEGEAAAESMAAAARSFCHVVLRMIDVPKFLLMQSGQVGANDCYINIRNRGNSKNLMQTVLNIKECLGLTRSLGDAARSNLTWALEVMAKEFPNKSDYSVELGWNLMVTEQFAKAEEVLQV